MTYFSQETFFDFLFLILLYALGYSSNIFLFQQEILFERLYLH